MSDACMQPQQSMLQHRMCRNTSTYRRLANKMEEEQRSNYNLKVKVNNNEETKQDLKTQVSRVDEHTYST